MPHQPELMLSDVKDEVRELHFGDNDVTDVTGVYGSLAIDVTQLDRLDARFIRRNCSENAVSGLREYCEWLRGEIDDQRDIRSLNTIINELNR